MLKLLLVLCFAQHALAASLDDDRARLDAMIRARQSVGLVQDMAVGLVSGSRDLRTAFYGAADSEVLFEIGSITKSFTGIAFAELVLEGRLKSVDAVELYVPELKGTFAGSVPLEQLATHTSGLPSIPPGFVSDRDPYRAIDTAALIRDLAALQRPAAGTAPYAASYSNLGFALLGLVLTRVDHREFSRLIERRITGPLGMRSTRVKPRGAQLEGHGMDREVVPAWHFEAFAPTGALHSNLHDMMIYARANLHPPQTLLGRAMQLSQDRNWGWDNAVASLPVHYKNGGTRGFRASLVIDRAQNLAAVVLSNLSYQIDTLALGFEKGLSEALPLAAAPADIAGSYQADGHSLIIEVIGGIARADVHELTGFSGGPDQARLLSYVKDEWKAVDNFGVLPEFKTTLKIARDTQGAVTGLTLELDLPGGQHQSVAFQRLP